MTLRHHEIAEAGHRILDPLVEPQLRPSDRAGSIVLPCAT